MVFSVTSGTARDCLGREKSVLPPYCPRRRRAHPKSGSDYPPTFTVSSRINQTWIEFRRCLGNLTLLGASPRRLFPDRGGGHFPLPLCLG